MRNKMLLTAGILISSVTLISCGGGGGSDKKSGGSSGVPGYSQNIDINQLQNQFYLNNMAFQTMSNILDIQNQTSQAIISNIGGGWDLEYDYSYYSVDLTSNPSNIPETVKNILKASLVSPQGSDKATVNCPNSGSIDLTLNWTNNSCDFNNLNKEFCFKNNDITFILGYNQCKDNTFYYNGSASLNVKFPQQPNTNNSGDYLPETAGFNLTNLEISFYNNQDSSNYSYNFQDMSLTLNLYNNSAEFSMSLEVKKNNATIFASKDLKIKYTEQVKGTAYYSLNGYVYGGENANDLQWYKFETQKDFKIEKKTINNVVYECVTEGKMVVNDVLTIEVVNDPTNGYLYKASDKNGQTKTEPACSKSK